MTQIEEILGFSSSKSKSSETVSRRFYVKADDPDAAKAALEAHADSLDVPDDLELGDVAIDEEKSAENLYYGTISFKSPEPRIKKKIDDTLFEVYGEKMSEGRKGATHERTFRIKAGTAGAAKDRLEGYIRGAALTSGRLHISDISVDEEQDAKGFFSGRVVYGNPDHKGPSDRITGHVAGKQPEVEAVRGTNVTGVTIKKVSPILGEGTLTLNYLNATKELQIRMGTSGDYGPTVTFTQDTQNVVLFARDLVGYIIVDVVFSQLSTANRTDTFTLTAPKGNMIPNYEGYETADGVGRTRYHLFVAKNRSSDPEEAISGMMFWTGRPAGAETTLSSSYSVPTTTPSSMNVVNATNWPTRGFWVKNKTIAAPKVDLRYVDYRSGNTLYVKPVIWGRINFKDGNSDLKPHTPITDSYSTSNGAVIDQVVVTSGSLADGTAAGTLYLKKYVGNMYSGYEIRVNGVKCAMSSSAFTRGYRDCSAVQWNSGNLVEPASDIDIGLEYPDENGLFSDPLTENIAPDGVIFECVDDLSRSQFAGPVFAGASLGIWLRQTILDGTQARTNIEGDVAFEYY